MDYNLEIKSRLWRQKKKKKKSRDCERVGELITGIYCLYDWWANAKQIVTEFFFGFFSRSDYRVWCSKKEKIIECSHWHATLYIKMQMCLLYSHLCQGQINRKRMLNESNGFLWPENEMSGRIINFIFPFLVWRIIRCLFGYTTFFFVLLFPTIKKWTLFSSHHCTSSFICFEPVPPQIFSSSPYGFFFTVSILITAFLFLSNLTPCSQSFLSHFSFLFWYCLLENHVLWTFD